MSRAQSVTFRKKGVWKDKTLQDDDDITDLKPEVKIVCGLVDVKQWADNECPLAEFLVKEVIRSRVWKHVNRKCAIYLQQKEIIYSEFDALDQRRYRE
jgi:hypothetical protein